MMSKRLIVGVVIVIILIVGVVAALSFSGTPLAQPPADLDSVQAQIDAGEYAEAQAALGEILERDPDNAGAHFMMGLTSLNLQEFEEARVHFERARELDPERAAAVHHNLGVLAYQLGDLATAQEEFTAALALDDDDPDTHYQLGATYLVQAIPSGSAMPDVTLLTQAQEEFERALELAPGQPEALVGLANIHILQGQMGEAIPLLEEAIEAYPQMREALFALGRAYAAVGNVSAARETLRDFLATDPPDMWRQQAEELLLELGE